MDSYDSPASSSLSRDDQAVMQQVQTELQSAYLSEFYQTVRDKCFERCVVKPGSSLGSSEQQCLARCADRYVDATEAVGKALLQMGGMGE